MHWEAAAGLTASGKGLGSPLQSELLWAGEGLGPCWSSEGCQHTLKSKAVFLNLSSTKSTRTAMVGRSPREVFMPEILCRHLG